MIDDGLQIREDTNGIIIPVKVVPNSSRDKVAGILGSALKITTSAPAEKGKANAAVAKTLAKALGVDKRNVQLVSGQTNPRKEFRVKGIEVHEVKRILWGKKLKAKS